MSMEMWDNVSKFRDGDKLNAATLNIPIGQLGDRTAYLYERLKALVASGQMSAVVLTGVSLSQEEGKRPEKGNIVYYDADTQTFAKAQATMSLYDDFRAADSAFTVGILSWTESTTGNVVVYGSMSLDSTLQMADMIESGETFRPGRYYLSANEAGRLTANPNGPRIYVCSLAGTIVNGLFQDGLALVNPQFLDIGEAHIHRTAVLTARPAGTLSAKGYLPIGDPDGTGQLSLRFSGTWTSDQEVTYQFWLANGEGSWPSGVMLNWRETYNDGRTVASGIPVPGPDIEVPISNGLTAQLSLSGSTATSGYAGLTVNQRTWPELIFPASGKGWLEHRPQAVLSRVASDGDSEGELKAHVAIRGKISPTPMQVYAQFPSLVQILKAGTIEDGDVFEYDGITYVFVADPDSDVVGHKVLVGPTLADSVHNLVVALNDSHENGFAVFDPSQAGTEAYLVAIDASDIPVDSSDSSDAIFIEKREARAPESSSESTLYNVVGATNIMMVVHDVNSWILGTSAIAQDVASYTWHAIGDSLAVMVFQDTQASNASSATIGRGDVMTGVINDDEPDALYDYAIGFERQIADCWPPIPPKSAALIVNGVEMDNKALLPDNPTVSFGRNTIHWFSDDDGRKPWPEAFVSRDEFIDPADDKTEVMHWVRGFQGATGPVTSLQAKDGSPLRIYGYGTDRVANTGDLEIDVALDFQMSNGGIPGFVVPKRMRNGRFISGAVVERVVGGAGVSVISRAGCPDGQGTVIVSLDDGSYHSQFLDIALENAEQAKIGMFPYIRLKGYANTITSPSAFTATMRVPINLPDGEYALRVMASVFGETGFTGAARRYGTVRFSYNILPDYTVVPGMEYRNLKTSLLKPNNDRIVNIPFGHPDDDGIVYNGFDPVQISTRDPDISSNIDDVIQVVLGENLPSRAEFYGQEGVSPVLKPGNLVGIRFARAVTPNDREAYTGPIGFINLSWTLMSIG